MNTEMMMRVADAIEKADRFDLLSWGIDGDGKWVQSAEELVHNCNTKACVCGWVNALVAADHDMLVRPEDTTTAQRALGLTYDQANELFTPDEEEGSIWGDNPYDIKSAEAALILREIARGERTFVCDEPEEFPTPTEELRDELLSI